MEAVADREGVTPEQLEEPLYGSVNPEALDSLFRASTGHVTFEYRGHTITVHSSGAVELEPVARP